MTPWRLLSRVLGERKRLVLLTVGYIVFISLFTLLIPFSVKLVLDYFLVQKVDRLFNYFCVGLVAIIAIKFFFILVQDHLVLLMRQHAERHLVMRYMRALFSFDDERFRALKDGDTVSRLAQVLNSFQYFLCEFVYFCAFAGLISSAILVTLFFVDRGIFWITLGCMALHALNFAIHNRLILRLSNAFFREKGAMADFLSHTFDGMVSIRTSLLTQRYSEDFLREYRRINLLFFRRESMSASQLCWQGLLLNTSNLVVVYHGATLIMQGKLTLGSLVLCLLLLGFAYEPIYRLAQITRSLRDTTAQLTRLYELIDQGMEQKSAEAEEQPVHALNLERLSFGYPDQAPILQEASFTFQRGHIYFLQGASGCGKSTLFKLLTGLAHAEAGSINFNGLCSRRIPAEGLRRRIAFAPQQASLFNGSLEENITSFDKDTDAPRFTRSTHVAVTDDFAERNVKRYRALTENMGLSGGQKQRLNLARTLYLDRDILLLDEPTASLDEQTEALFFNRLSELKQDKIIIVISHRPKTWAWADVVVRLDQRQLQTVVRETA